MSSNGNNASIVWVVFVLVVITVVIQMVAGTSSTSGPAPVSTGTPEYRYARERFRQEGYSSSDADTAARAVIRFHEAQKNR